MVHPGYTKHGGSEFCNGCGYPQGACICRGMPGESRKSKNHSGSSSGGTVNVIEWIGAIVILLLLFGAMN